MTEHMMSQAAEIPASRQEDIWDNFAGFLASMIEKYAAELDLDNLPVPNKPAANEK